MKAQVQRAPVMPKRTHYVSMHNNGIYPAMSSPSGYEDEHPEDYRPASPEEIAKYKAGAESVHIESIDLTPVGDDEPPLNASPTMLRLADDDPEPVPVSAAIPPAPAIPSAPAPMSREM